MQRIIHENASYDFTASWDGDDDGMNCALDSLNDAIDGLFFKTTVNPNNPNVQQVRGQNIIANEIAGETIHPGGAEAYAMTKGLVSALPGVGMIMDLEALTDTNNSASTRAMAGLSIALVFTIPIDDLGKAAKNTGQLHHPISKRIAEALDKIDNISQAFKDHYREFKTRAADLNAHRGYWGWHETLDNKIVDWLQKNKKATQEEFIAKLIEFYKDPRYCREVSQLYAGFNRLA